MTTDIDKNITVSRLTGEKIALIRRKCKCGHTINFIRRKPSICRNCGNYVYPDDEYEFAEKLKKEMNKRWM